MKEEEDKCQEPILFLFATGEERANFAPVLWSSGLKQQQQEQQQQQQQQEQQQQQQQLQSTSYNYCSGFD